MERDQQQNPNIYNIHTEISETIEEKKEKMEIMISPLPSTDTLLKLTQKSQCHKILRNRHLYG